MTIWDVGQGKFEASYHLHTAKITGLQFLDFYNVLLASSLDGTISAWGHRPIKSQFRNQCIFKLLICEYSLECEPRVEYAEQGGIYYKRKEQLVPVTGIQANC